MAATGREYAFDACGDSTASGGQTRTVAVPKWLPDCCHSNYVRHYTKQEHQGGFVWVSIDSGFIIEALGPIVRADAHTIDVEPVAVVAFLVPKFRVLIESWLLLQPLNCAKGGHPRFVRANKEHLLIARTQSRKVV